MYLFKRLVLGLTFLGLLSLGPVLGQENNCSQVLKKAESTYDQGRLYEIEKMLKPCLEKGFTKEERIGAYKLLTLTYLYFNEKGKAEESMTSFLKLNPEYEINTAIDPAEFINLYNSFRTTPAWLVGLKAGGNGVDIDVIKNYSLDNAENPQWEYESETGFQVGLLLEKPINKRFSVLAEINYLVENYQYTDSLFDYAAVTYKEDISWLQVPVFINYRFGKSKKFAPYINLGASFNYLLKAEALVNRKDKAGEGSQREVRDRRIDVKDQRNPFNVNISIGGGIKVKDVIGRGYIFFDIRYSRALINYVDPDQRYSNPELIYDFLYLDKDFKINSFQLSLGYSLPLYKPKLKRTNRKDL